MPYIKEIGRTPRYVSEVTTKWYPEHMSREISDFLHQVNVPAVRTHYKTRFGVTFQDCYEAYVDSVARMTPFQKSIERIMYN